MNVSFDKIDWLIGNKSIFLSRFFFNMQNCEYRSTQTNCQTVFKE